MKLYWSIIILIILSILFNIFNYTYFINLLSITWYVASILILFLSIKYSYKLKFIQLRFNKIFSSLKSKSNNNITPLSSLCISLAAKIGVGSLSGVALCLYFGGLGSFFWLCIISILVSVNTYLECILGIKYREKYNKNYIGGPSYYINKCLKNKKLAILYSILIIVTYSGFFLSIQSNTIINTLEYFNINTLFLVIIIFTTTLIIILTGRKGISKVNSILVPVMLIFYFIIGIYILYNNIDSLIIILKRIIKEAFKIKSIIPVFLIGMQRAIFITESSLGTSAIASSSCDNDAKKQAMLEVLGIHIVTFVVCLTTFIIISTTDYYLIDFGNLNGIEIVMYAFNYHFGKIGTLLLTIITTLFAFSTIISSYFFGESNLKVISNNKIINQIFKIFFLIIVVVSCYIKPNILWDLCDYFIALISIINTYSIIKIYKNESP